HYFKRRLRPMAAYTMGLIFFWNKIAGMIPGIANFFLQTKPFSTFMKWIAGVSQERELPKYALKTFRKVHQKELQSKQEKKTQKQVVILWVDSFNNYFHPDVLYSLFQSLDHAGYKIKLSSRKLCCGRPLYDFGMLDTAKRFLKEILDDLHDEIIKGT